MGARGLAEPTPKTPEYFLTRESYLLHEMFEKKTPFILAGPKISVKPSAQVQYGIALKTRKITVKIRRKNVLKT